jgi:uridine phosphorylase
LPRRCWRTTPPSRRCSALLPTTPPVRDFPAAVVLCFFSEVVDAVADRPDARLIATLTSVEGSHPVWAIDVDGRPVAVFRASLGAPAAVGFFEELIALGGRCFVAVGGAGALRPDLVLGHAVIVSGAVRDEGTSFHYLPPTRTVDADPAGVDVLRRVLTAAGVPHLVARTWTTDAIYRETRTRIARRIAEGCATVEMEAAALIAAARHHQVSFAQLLYAADSLAGEQWDHRDWTTAAARQPLFDLAARAAATWAATTPVR